MREIKFRAWDEGNKVMHYDFQWIQSGNEGNDWICFVSDKTPWPSVDNGILFNNPYFSQQLKKMQFTGIRDKNGKEIYDGDILSFADTYFYEVRFEDAKFVCYHLNKQYGKWGDLSRIYDVDFAKYGGIEIIGNIYEHPELLNK